MINQLQYTSISVHLRCLHFDHVLKKIIFSDVNIVLI